jgi:hypothetical protein
VLDVTYRPSGPDAFQPAQLQLRGSSGPLSARLCWPGPAPPLPRPGLLVFLGGWPLGQRLAVAARLVLLGLDAGLGLDDAVSVTGWAADHAGELGADPDRLVVGGSGPDAWTAAVVAGRARDDGWPALRAQVLIAPTTATATPAGSGLPSGAGGSALVDPTGLARAIVVLDGKSAERGGNAAGYIRRLRAGGVHADVLGLDGSHGDPVADVAAALDRALTTGRDVA